MDSWQIHGSIDSVLFVLRHPWESASSMTRQTGLPLPLTYAGWKDSILNFWNIEHKYPVHIVDYNSLFQKDISSKAMEPLFKFLDIKFDHEKADNALSSTIDKKMRRYKGTEKKLPKSIKNIFGKFFNDISMEFILLLISNNDFSIYNDTLTKIIILMESDTKIRKIKITSHKEYSSDEQSEILLALKNKFNFDDTSETNFSVNPNIMGGIKVRIGNKIIDGSVSTKLKKIKQSLLGI